MRMKVIAGLCVGGMMLCVASTAWANVYPSGPAISAATFNDLTGTAKITYVLNENADGDGVNPGVKIEVLSDTLSVVRTVSIARQLKGTHEFEWDGRADNGSRVDDANKNYTVKITASDYGYTAWTQISTDDTNHSFWSPLGISVNRNPASANYGKVYVSNASVGTTTFGRPCSDGIYMLNADGSDAGFATGGKDWSAAGTSSPFKSTIGPDDHLYVSDFSNDLAFEFSADMSSVTQLIDAANKNSLQYVESMVVEGTQAAGNRKLYLVDSNYNSVAHKGLIRYTLGSQAAATANDKGTQYIGPGYFSYYPRDFSRDSSGNWYTCQYRSTSGQAPPLSKFLDSATLPINAADWEASTAYTGAYGLDIDEPRGRVAYPDYYTGYVRIFDMATGTFQAEFDSGSRGREVAFDAAGNLYYVDNSVEWLRVWSPPDGANSSALTTAAINLNTKAGSGGPVISDHPDDVAICPAGTAAFHVVASGGTLTYAWKKNGAALANGGDVAGADTADLTLSNVQATDDGALITCVITDANGVAVSNPAVLSVGVFFSQAPISQIICQNTNATFTVAAANVTGYQWQRATAAAPTTFVDIGGEISSTLVLTNVPAGDTGTRIRCHVTGPCGDADSPVAILTVRSGPTIGTVALSYVTPAPRPSGGSATFYAILVSATGTPHYQWKRDGVDLVDGVYPWGVVSSATGPNLVITELTCTASGSITVAITDDCGTTTSVCNAVPPVTGQSCYLQVGTTSETCNNGVDDDCDGQVDCADGDCSADPFCGPSCNQPFADWNLDGDVDMDDFADMQRCFAVDPATTSAECECFDHNNDGHVDITDVAAFAACGSGPGILADPACDNLPSGLGKVVINEVAYDMLDAGGLEIVDQFEFVELFNRSATDTVDISGWILKASDIAADNNRDFIVPGGAGSGTTLLAPGGFYVFTSPNVPVPAANPPALNFLTLPNPTDIWENGPDVLELLDANKDVVDTLIYGRSIDSALTLSTAGEGLIWGDLSTVYGGITEQSVSRYFDGRDNDDNGRDFGLRKWTPGTSNHAGSSVVTNYTLPTVDAAALASVVPGLDAPFQPVVVINPADNTAQYTTPGGSYVVNPNVIAASPQGGNAAVVWDFATGGGNMAASSDLMDNAGGFDLYVYLDTSFAAWPVDTGIYESTSYGVMGTTDTKYYRSADPDAILYGNIVASGGNTGLCWVFNKAKTASTTVCKMFLCDAGAGGDSSPPSSPWVVQQTIDMTASPSGWYRLSIAYDGVTGAVTAKLGATTYNFVTATGLAGGFYVGYREGTPAVPGTTAIDYLRPATFDTAP